MAGLLLLVAADALGQDEEEAIDADRPGLADGSKVVAPGHFVIEAGVQKEFRRDATTSEHRLTAPLLLRAGVAPKWELRVETDTYVLQTTRTASGMTREEGSAPLSLGAKHQITGADDGSALSLGVIARLNSPSGAGEFRARHTTGDLRLVADWSFADKWSINPNIGVGRHEDDAGRPVSVWLAAATLGHNPTASLGLFVDAAVQSPEKKRGRAAVIVDAGLAYFPARDVQLDFSAGKGVRGDTPPRAFVSFGISKKF